MYQSITEQPTACSTIPFEDLVAAGSLAPSGDNTQPWRFHIDRVAGRIAVQVDRNRDVSPMNCGQRMSRIAIGAAVENILRVAGRNGLRTTLHADTDPNVVEIQFHGQTNEPVHFDHALKARATNRRFYDGRIPDRELIRRLELQTATLDGVETIWVVDRPSINRIAEVVGAADSLLFAQPHLRTAILENVRFDAPSDAEVQEGLSLASLEVNGLERIFFRYLPRIPASV